MVKAILFDFWGTLMESGVGSVLHASYKLIRPRMDFSSFVIQFENMFMTREFPDQATGFREACDALNARCPPFVIDRLVGLWNKSKLLAHPYPETLEVLQSLKDRGFKLALVSNAPKDNVDGVVEKYDMAKYFDHIHISSKMGLLKQDPKTFDHVASALGVTKEEMLMVGDSMETDIEGAQNAGVKAVLVDRRGTRDFKDKILDLKQLDTFL